MTLAARMLRDPFLTDFRMLDGLFGREVGSGTPEASFIPALELRTSEDEYLVLVDLPGVKQEDVTVEFEDGVLTISGTRVPVEFGEAQRVERPYGQFVRSLTLPRGVDGDNIVANYTDGVLELRIPKPAEYRPRKIAIGSSSREAIER